MIALDTDVFSDLLRGRTEYVRKVEPLLESGLAITVVTAEELLRGSMNAIKIAGERKSKFTLEVAYALMDLQLVQIMKFTWLSYIAAAHGNFLRLRATAIRIGTQDLRIASIRLAHDATLVTRNRRDFEQIPNLKLDVWN